MMASAKALQLARLACSVTLYVAMLPIEYIKPALRAVTLYVKKYKGKPDHQGGPPHGGVGEGEVGDSQMT